jgi:hypothetical protein
MIKLTDGQEVEYHPSFHFPPHIFSKMRDEDKERMQKQQKEYNRSKDQDRQIQSLQQQLSVATSVAPSSPTDNISVGQASQISQITQNTVPGSTMFGGRNEQSNFRRRPT